MERETGAGGSGASTPSKNASSAASSGSRAALHVSTGSACWLASFELLADRGGAPAADYRPDRQDARASEPEDDHKHKGHDQIRRAASLGRRLRGTETVDLKAISVGDPLLGCL